MKVDLPEPEGPITATELAGLHVERDPVEGRDAAGVELVDAVSRGFR
jgi:hypothetical protein